MNAFDDYFARMMPDAVKWLEELAAEPVAARQHVVPMGEPLNDDVPPGYFRPVGEPFTVRKITYYTEVPDELLMDAGLIPDTRPKPPPPTWRTRLRWKRDAWRERAARRAFRIIAGYWPDNGEDDW